jgi:hypothetical protein
MSGLLLEGDGGGVAGGTYLASAEALFQKAGLLVGSAKGRLADGAKMDEAGAAVAAKIFHSAEQLSVFSGLDAVFLTAAG